MNEPNSFLTILLMRLLTAALYTYLWQKLHCIDPPSCSPRPIPQKKKQNQKKKNWERRGGGENGREAAM